MTAHNSGKLAEQRLKIFIQTDEIESLQRPINYAENLHMDLYFANFQCFSPSIKHHSYRGRRIFPKKAKTKQKENAHTAMVISCLKLHQ
jgi:hypothetical protein